MLTRMMQPFFRKGKVAPFCLPGTIDDGCRILCIDAGDLAEDLFHMPLLTGIRRRWPGAKIDFLVPEDHAPLIVPTGIARQCLVYKEGQLNPWRPAFGSLLRQLGQNKYDVSIVMSFQPQAKFELVGLASGASLRFGPSHEDSWPGVNFELRPSADVHLYLGDRIQRVAPFLGLGTEDLDPRWPLPADKLRQMAQQVHFHKPNPDQMLIGIDPGVGQSGNVLAIDNFQFLARGLNEQLVCRILPLTHPRDRVRLEKFEAGLPTAHRGLERDTLLEMVLLLAQCDVFLAGNTDFFHLAVAMGVPTVGLFTKGDGRQWYPQGRPKVRVLKITKGRKVALDHLMAEVKAVIGGRVSRPSRVIAGGTSEIVEPNRTGQEA